MKTRIFNFVFPVLALLAMSSCREKEWTYDNKVFISGDKVTSTILKPSVKSLEAELVAAVARPVDQTVNVTFVADASLIEAYNASYFDHAVMLPEANWTMSSNSTRIQEGTIESSPLALSFHDLDQLPCLSASLPPEWMSLHLPVQYIMCSEAVPSSMSWRISRNPIILNSRHSEAERALALTRSGH